MNEFDIANENEREKYKDYFKQIALSNMNKIESKSTVNLNSEKEERRQARLKQLKDESSYVDEKVVSEKQPKMKKVSRLTNDDYKLNFPISSEMIQDSFEKSKNLIHSIDANELLNFVEEDNNGSNNEKDNEDKNTNKEENKSNKDKANVEIEKMTSIINLILFCMRTNGVDYAQRIFETDLKPLISNESVLNSDDHDSNREDIEMADNDSNIDDNINVEKANYDYEKDRKSVV